MPDVQPIKSLLLDSADNYEKAVKSAVTPGLNPIRPVQLLDPHQENQFLWSTRAVPTSKEQALCHLLWLCDQLREKVMQEDFSTCRDICAFIEGVLWYMGRPL